MKCIFHRKHFQGKRFLLALCLNTSSPFYTRTTFVKLLLDTSIYPCSRILYVPFRICCLRKKQLYQSVFDVSLILLLRSKRWNSNQKRENVGNKKLLNAYCGRVH